MQDLSSGRIGALIVRLWIEPNHEAGLRARITQSVDSGLTERSIAVVASADDIYAVVRQWVEAFTQG